jgi:hypothetical protein
METAMDEFQLGETIAKLLIAKRQVESEQILMREYAAAKRSGDNRMLDVVLGLLVHVYVSSRPPNLIRGREVCAEREANLDSAYNMVQTGLFLYYAADDPKAAAAKLRDAVTKAKNEGQDPTLYSSLALLGCALLDLDRVSEAADALREIERMVLEKRRFAPGDETNFLECAFRRNVEVDTVKRIAAILAPLCREASFERRLNALANKV